MDSATRATRVMLPKGVTKLLQVNSGWSLPLTRFQPFVLASRAVISASESFFAGMSSPSRIGWRFLQPLCFPSPAPARILVSPARGADLAKACSGSSLNARGNSIIVGVSPETKIRGVCHCSGDLREVIVLATAKRSTPQRDGQRRAKENSRHPVWCRPDRRIDCVVDAAQTGN